MKMARINENVVGRRPKKNNFNLSHERLMTGQIGKLHVVDRYPVTAGDRFDSSVAFLMLFEPLATPAMVRMNVHFHAFYVPNRIITPRNSTQSTWEQHFMSLGKPSEDVPVLPYINGSIKITQAWVDEFGDNGTREHLRPDQWAVGSLADDLGLCVYSYAEFNSNVGSTFRLPSSGLSLLPFLGYHRIYQDFYRRDQIEREMALPLSLHAASISDFDSWDYVDDERSETGEVDPFIPSRLFDIQTRNYERDYFTSALPEPQFGDDVIVGDNEVYISDRAGIQVAPFMLQAGTGTYPNGEPLLFYNQGKSFVSADNQETGIGPIYFRPEDDDSSNEFKITGLTGISTNSFTINELRLAMQLQGVKEKINRGGTRYLEMMRSIYGVTVPDARLQRAQFLGGASFPVTIGQVVQTSETANTPQGTLTGRGTSAGGNQLFRSKFEFTEPGQVYIIMSVTPRTSYMGGTPRDFLFKYPEDWYVPDFDHLGEEEIYSIQLSSEHITNWDQQLYDSRMKKTFGYTPRYSYYKQGHSTATGTFRNIDDTWSVTREFKFIPSLSTDFIKAEKEDFERIFAVQDVEGDPIVHFKAQIVHNLIGKRPMSKYSTPYTFY